MSNDKYYGRHLSVVSRDSSLTEKKRSEPDWVTDFATNLERNSTHSRREDISSFDQINRIIGNKSKYSTVEEAVLDMQRRSGLYDYLNKVAAAASPQIFYTIPEMKIFIDNFLEDRPGIAVEAVVSAILKNDGIKKKLPNANDITDDIRRYISDKIAELKALKPSNENNSMDIGKLDVSDSDTASKDNDPFSGCDPVTNK